MTNNVYIQFVFATYNFKELFLIHITCTSTAISELTIAFTILKLFHMLFSLFGLSSLNPPLCFSFM